MTKSSKKELVEPYTELERVLHSRRKLFKTTSLDYSSSPEFDLFFDHEDEPKSYEKAKFELKGQFLKELRDNTFSGTNREDAVEHIEKFLKIVDSLDIPNVTHDQLRLSIFPISLVGAARKWFTDELDDSFTTWVDLTEIDIDVLTDDLPGFKTYKEYKNAWIYEWNKDVPLVADRPWLDYGPWMEPCDDIEHACKPFRFKNGQAKANNDAEIQENEECFDERGPMEDNDDDIDEFDDYLARDDAPFIVNEEDEKSKEKRAGPEFLDALGEAIKECPL
nr:hypothetical protein [Tanacetum cinerariifolium]